MNLKLVSYFSKLEQILYKFSKTPLGPLELNWNKIILFGQYFGSDWNYKQQFQSIQWSPPDQDKIHGLKSGKANSILFTRLLPLSLDASDMFLVTNRQPQVHDVKGARLSMPARLLKDAGKAFKFSGPKWAI